MHPCREPRYGFYSCSEGKIYKSACAHAVRAWHAHERVHVRQVQQRTGMMGRVAKIATEERVLPPGSSLPPPGNIRETAPLTFASACPTDACLQHEGVRVGAFLFCVLQK